MIDPPKIDLAEVEIRFLSTPRQNGKSITLQQARHFIESADNETERQLRKQQVYLAIYGGPMPVKL